MSLNVDCGIKGKMIRRANLRRRAIHEALKKSIQDTKIGSDKTMRSVAVASLLLMERSIASHFRKIVSLFETADFRNNLIQFNVPLHATKRDSRLGISKTAVLLPLFVILSTERTKSTSICTMKFKPLMLELFSTPSHKNPLSPSCRWAGCSGTP